MSFKHSNKKFTVALTGGGSLFLSDRLTEAGASQYLVAGIIPYDTKDLERFVGGLREKACSESSARQLAVAAERHAKGLGIDSIGIGATCSLSKGSDEREGRVHNIFIAAKYKEHCISLEWTHGLQKYTRLEEELLAASLIKDVAEIFGAYISELSHLSSPKLEDMFKTLSTGVLRSEIKVNIPSELAVQKMKSLLSVGASLTYANTECFSDFKQNDKNVICVYPGSWNPIHEAHRKNFETCVNLYGKENCFLEISINNFEKPPIDSLELTRRLKGMRDLTKNILISPCPLFSEKLETITSNISNSSNTRVVFAVGFDTFERVESIEGCSFLVFPRNGKRASPINFSGNSIERESYDLPEGIEISSSSIRKR